MDLEFTIQTIISGAAAGGVYALIAIGFGLVYQTTRVFNFAQGGFATLGAYLAFTVTVTWGLGYFAGALAACAVVALAAGSYERLALRPIYKLGELQLFISTVGLSFMIESGVQWIWGPSPRAADSVLGDQAVDVLGVRVVPEVLWVLGGSLLIGFVVHRLLNGTRYGTAMRACPQDPEVAALMGINTDRMRSGAFCIGGAIAALGGVLVAPLVVLQPTLGTTLAIPGFIAAVVGGLGSIPGAMIGGLILGILQASSIFVISPEYKDAVVYVLLVVVLLVRPAGLFRGADPALREA